WAKLCGGSLWAAAGSAGSSELRASCREASGEGGREAEGDGWTGLSGREEKFEWNQRRTGLAGVAFGGGDEDGIADECQAAAASCSDDGRARRRDVIAEGRRMSSGWPRTLSVCPPAIHVADKPESRVFSHVLFAVNINLGGSDSLPAAPLGSPKSSMTSLPTSFQILSRSLAHKVHLDSKPKPDDTIPKDWDVILSSSIRIAHPSSSLLKHLAPLYNAIVDDLSLNALKDVVEPGLTVAVAQRKRQYEAALCDAEIARGDEELSRDAAALPTRFNADAKEQTGWDAWVGLAAEVLGRRLENIRVDAVNGTAS
ncbi:hypothetical protein K488DRAFT_74639, partial [Vararia minispora EC-137]